jgi:hypothetical protein
LHEIGEGGVTDQVAPCQRFHAEPDRGVSLPDARRTEDERIHLPSILSSLALVRMRSVIISDTGHPRTDSPLDHLLVEGERAAR